MRGDDVSKCESFSKGIVIPLSQINSEMSMSLDAEATYIRASDDRKLLSEYVERHRKDKITDVVYDHEEQDSDKLHLIILEQYREVESLELELKDKDRRVRDLRGINKDLLIANLKLQQYVPKKTKIRSTKNVSTKQSG